MPIDHQGTRPTSLAATRQGRSLIDYMPTQLGIDQAAIHFFNSRQQGFGLQVAAAEAEITQAANQAREELRASVATLAVLGASKILEKEIDAEAHRGALDAEGLSLAVTGTGLDRVYPAKNRALAHEIAMSGLLVSEFPTGTPPLPAHFPRRNRILAGLALGTLVVEAAQRSGSLITARLATEAGREVFAIPGSIHNPQAKGCHQLIRQGAKLVDQASDIIDDIGSLLGYVAQQVDSTSMTAEQSLDQEYQQLLDIIGYDPVSIDTLVERSGLTIEQLSSMLLILELNDHIQPAPGGLYSRR